MNIQNQDKRAREHDHEQSSFGCCQKYYQKIIFDWSAAAMQIGYGAQKPEEVPPEGVSISGTTSCLV